MFLVENLVIVFNPNILDNDTTKETPNFDFLTNILELTFNYIWANHLCKNNKGCALVGTKTSNNNKNNNNTSTTTSNVSTPCLQPPNLCSFIPIVHHIDRWSCPKFMHISKFT